jgi:hypothetical protein
MNIESSIQHDLRREFQNMLGLIKIIKKENIELDQELKDMIDLCLKRESDISSRFDELSALLERIHV